MEERRSINRTDYSSKGVIVICDSEQKLYVEIKNISPCGMGISAPVDCPDIMGKDIIVIAETMIMYATVNRMEQNEDGRYIIGIEARKFSDEVLKYLFEKIG